VVKHCDRNPPKANIITLTEIKQKKEGPSSIFRKTIKPQKCGLPIFPTSRRAQQEQRDKMINNSRGKSNQSSSSTDFLMLMKMQNRVFAEFSFAKLFLLPPNFAFQSTVLSSLCRMLSSLESGRETSANL
jgi:hypothetical protein